ncbi:MAG: ATP-dependent dethiobiotin synthetase BioD, partial [Desulfovibrionaceae bacterium]
ALAVKPVQTGCEPDADGTLRAPDVEAYLAAAGDRLPASARGAMTCLTFRRACSPHLAAAQEADDAAPGADILERIQAHVRALPQRSLLVEGAGGVMVPLGGRATMLDLMARLGLPVLLAAPNRLGAVNHVLLSLAALDGRGLAVAGVVLTQPQPLPDPDPDADIRADNPGVIARLGGVPVLAEIPHTSGAHTAAGRARLDPIFDGLCRRLGFA